LEGKKKTLLKFVPTINQTKEFAYEKILAIKKETECHLIKY